MVEKWLDRLKGWYNWLLHYGWSIYLAWYLLAPDIVVFKELWKVARDITAERFVEAVVVGLVILVVMHFAAKRFPALDDDIYPFIERVADRWTPHLVNVSSVVAPPVGRAFMVVWRPVWSVLVTIGGLIWRALKFVGRLIWRVMVVIGHFMALLGGLISRMIPNGAKVWMARRAQRSLNEAEDDEREEAGGERLHGPRRYPRNKYLDHFLGGNWFMLALYAGIILGLNELINRPGQSAWEWLLKVASLTLTVLLMGRSYRVALILFMLECYLLWVSVTQGVKVGTVYMLMFAAAYLLWRISRATAFEWLTKPKKSGDTDDKPDGTKEG